MAIININANLNGGDDTTPNNELFYRIYGDIDAYASPIHTTGTALSDADVTVTGDVVDISNVDGTTNTSFKIAAVDGAGNEGILSDAHSSFIILFQDDFAGSVLNPSGEWTVTDPGDGVTISQNDALLFTTTGISFVTWGDNTYGSTVTFGSDFACSIDIASATNWVDRQFGFVVKSIAGDTNIGLRCQRPSSTNDADVFFYDSAGTTVVAPGTDFIGVDPLVKTWKVSHFSNTLKLSYWNGSSWIDVLTEATGGLIDSDLSIQLRTGDDVVDSAGVVTYNNCYVSSSDYSTQYPV